MAESVTTRNAIRNVNCNCPSDCCYASSNVVPFPAPRASRVTKALVWQFLLQALAVFLLSDSPNDSVFHALLCCVLGTPVAHAMDASVQRVH